MSGVAFEQAFSWWLLGLPLLAALLVLVFRRRTPRASEQDERLERLAAEQRRLLAVADQLEEESRLGRGGGGAAPASRALRELDAQTLELLTEAQALGDEVAHARAAIAEGDAVEADALLTSVQRRLGPLEAELAGAITTMAGIADDKAEVHARCEAARARLAALRGRAVGDNGLAILAERLAQAERLATEDPQAAREIVEGVGRALDRLEGRSNAVDAGFGRPAP